MLKELQKELITAMKSKNKMEIICLRNMLGKLKTAQIDKGDQLTENESLGILKSYAKRLKDSIYQYKKGGRNELAKKESFELLFLEKYLPEQLSEEKIRVTINNIIKDSKAQSTQDLGKIMGVAMKQFAGLADGVLVQKIVREELSK